MQANTAEVPKQPINFANFSVENKPYDSDPFTIKDGHYVGHDGFIVPKGFDEFHERFPLYVRNWVKRHADSTASKEDVEDWTHDLLIHLRYLPLNSKHREAGKEDVIQTFDPVKHYGANQARFQNYINLCLANKFRSLHSSRMKDALSQYGNMSLDAQREWEDPCSVDDEYCHSHSEHLQRAANASDKRNQNRAFLTEFEDFVGTYNPKMVPLLEAIALIGTQEGAARKLELTGTAIGRLYRELRDLGHSFTSRKARLQLGSRVMLRYEARRAKTPIPDTPSQPPNLGRAFRSISWNRLELYNEVWDQPLVKLSRKYGISDVRLGKVCRKLRIPHPGRGYWAKRVVGQNVEQVPLPEFNGAPVVRRMKTRNAAVRVDRVSVSSHHDVARNI